jgi:hypothetical protein
MVPFLVQMAWNLCDYVVYTYETWVLILSSILLSIQFSWMLQISPQFVKDIESPLHKYYHTAASHSKRRVVAATSQHVLSQSDEKFLKHHHSSRTENIYQN